MQTDLVIHVLGLAGEEEEFEPGLRCGGGGMGRHGERRRTRGSSSCSSTWCRVDDAQNSTRSDRAAHGGQHWRQTKMSTAVRGAQGVH